MFLLQKIHISLMIVALVTCAPTSDTSFFDAIAKKCPDIKKYEEFKKINEFRGCKNWKPIMTSITDENLLCSIFYNSFTHYCTSATLNPSHIKNSFMYNISLICDNLDVVSPGDINLKEVINTKDKCYKTCSTIMGDVNPSCSRSFYFGHFKDTTALPQNVKLPIVEQNKLSHVILQDSRKPVPELAPQFISETNNPKEPVQTNKSEQPNTDQINLVQKTNTPNIKNQEVSAGTNEQKTPPNANQAKDTSLKNKIVDTKDLLNAETLQENKKLDPNPEPDSSKTNSQNNVDNGKVDAENVVPKPENNGKISEETAVKPETKIENPESKIENSEKKNENPEINIENSDDGQIDPQDVDMGNEENDEVVVEDRKPEFSEQEASNVNPNVDSAVPVNYNSELDGDSYFFTYFMLLCGIFIVGYICYHNKQKILALILEGRRGKRQYRSRRPNSANYHKLDTNLEEAITSSVNKNTNNVIY